MSIPSDNDDLPPSKSQRKRDMAALQKIGEALVRLSAAQLAKIPLEPILAEAITEARKLTAHGAIKRQLQYIGKLMRSVDPAPIIAAMDLIESKSKQSKAQFHFIERWRDRLINEDDSAVQAFVEKYPSTDRQKLRQLVRNAKKPEASTAELFRYIRDIIG